VTGFPPPTVAVGTRPVVAVDPRSLPGLPPRAAQVDDWRQRPNEHLTVLAPTSWAFLGDLAPRVVTRPASFGKRFGARCLDQLTYGALSSVIVFATARVQASLGSDVNPYVGVAVVCVTFCLLWMVQLLRLRAIAQNGAAIGQQRVGIRVVRPGTMDPIGWWRTIARELVAAAFVVGGIALVIVGASRLGESQAQGQGLLFISAGLVCYLVDPLWMLVDGRGRTLHDIVAGSVVIDLRG